MGDLEIDIKESRVLLDSYNQKPRLEMTLIGQKPNKNPQIKFIVTRFNTSQMKKYIIG